MSLENIKAVSIESEMKNSFLDYSMSVIVSRALPDVRDGLKPVHRRILFAMHNLKNFHNRPFLKSARIVGDVMGKYHPHGDMAIYDALVRMAQGFSMRYPLIDGQGNFGSIDGDSAAAQRYTESRMAEFAEFLLADLDKDTVDFVPNYDNKEEEPSVLPTMLPQLLVNGASGIAVGMATNIPPHNLREVLSGLKAFIENPQISLLELMEHIKGPDFPTKAEIHGVLGIKEAYESGKGSVIMRAKAHVEDLSKSQGRESIVITEIPYQVNKARLIEKIADLVQNKKIEGISDLRDESAKEDIRIVIDLKKGESSEVILNNLFKLTPLQSSFSMNFVGLVRGLPKLLSLKEILSEFYAHRKEVVLRRTSFLLAKAEEKAHILLGLKIALENSDGIISLIKASQSSLKAQEALMQNYSLSETQAKAILDMRLARLTSLEREKIVEDYEKTVIEIKDFKNILSDFSRVKQIILDEIAQMEDKFADDRKTQIILTHADNFTMESLIADEEVAVTVTYGGYVKRTNLSSIAAQKRGGKGKSGMLTREEDFVQNLFITSNHQSLLCFTDQARVYELKVYQLPEAALRGKGRHFANLIKLASDERVVSVLPVANFESGFFILCVTSNGYVKKTDLMAYASVRSSGIIGLKLEPNDKLIRCLLCKEGDEVILATSQGKAIRFDEKEVRPMGRSSRGVTGIRFGEDSDKVIGAEIVKSEGSSYIFSVCENGFGKRTELSEYKSQSRGGKGIYTIKVSERNGPVVGICQVEDTDDLMLMTSSGKLMRFAIQQMGVIGRLTQGVKLMSLSPSEKIIGFSKVEQAADEKIDDKDGQEGENS